ncbi:MAG: glutaredoxin [Oceanospirillaceae bacterium]|nr:glutaredoxin [Oceanospirillaceae bacterium]
MTPRKTLDQNKIHPTISPSVEQYHSDIVNQVINAVEENEAVVIGMALNPSVKRARKLLEKQGLKVTYLEFGGYGSMWRERLAIKMWSGWPTYPQIFIKGTLVGGASDLKKLIINKAI